MNVKAVIRTLNIIFLILVYTIVSGAMGLLPIGRWRVQTWRGTLHMHFCRAGLWLLNVVVNVKAPYNKNENYLVVSNHLSYLDILIISSQIPCCFVTSVEIKETPILGVITRWGGCLFVERRSKENLSEEIIELTEGLKHGSNVTIFPEATSTNGEKILRFRTPLYNAAIESGRKVLPVCLNYKFVEKQKINVENRDRVFWYGDMSFFPHFLELMKLSSLEVDFEFLDAIEQNQQTTAKSFAQHSQFLVEQRYVPCI